MKLLDQMKQEIRFRHYGIRTEKSYVDWVIRFINFNKRQHPKDLGETEKKVSKLAGLYWKCNSFDSESSFV